MERRPYHATFERVKGLDERSCPRPSVPFPSEMTGRGSFKWTDEQRHALERRVLDEHESAAQAWREAKAGELRAELAGVKLEPFDIPLSSVHHIVKVERRKRRDLHLEAAEISDPDLAHREMSRLLLSELRNEMQRMSSSFRNGSARKRTAWAELQAAAKTLEMAARATQVRSNGKPESNGASEAPEPDEAPSLVARLAKDNGRPSSTSAATKNEGGESEALRPGQPEQSVQTTQDQSVSPVR